MGKLDITRIRRTQRDYTLGFKLSVVALVEQGDMSYKQAQRHYGIQGRSTVLTWLRKHGKLDWTKPVEQRKMPYQESPAQKIKRLERELEDEKIRNQIYRSMFDTLHKEHGIDIGKKSSIARSGLPKKQSK